VPGVFVGVVGGRWDSGSGGRHYIKVKDSNFAVIIGMGWDRIVPGISVGVVLGQDSAWKVCRSGIASGTFVGAIQLKGCGTRNIGGSDIKVVPVPGNIRGSRNSYRIG
jgi:hypothetical protein